MILKKYLITSGKGGTGKSTAAAGCAMALGSLGKRVLLVDADAGLRGLDLLLQMEESVAFDLGDVLAGRCDADSALLAVPGFPSVFLLAGPARTRDFCDPTAFRNLMTRLSEQFDFILIDGPAGFGTGFSVAAAGADAALVVALPDELSLRGAAKAVLELREAGIEEAFLLVNRFPKKPRGCPGIDRMIDGTRLQLLGVVPEDARLLPGSRETLAEAKRPAAGAFSRLGRRLSGEYVPLVMP